jgi:HK97 family phage portal protein
VNTLKIPFISRFFQKRSLPEKWEEVLMRSMGIFTGKGAPISQTKAMEATAVFACVRIISGTIASLPSPVYRRLKPRGKERDPNHPVHKLLSANPNPKMTAFTFKEMMMVHLLLWGNCFAEIETDQWGDPVALWPIPPWRVTVMETQLGDVYYRVSLKDGKQHDVPDYRMLHIPGLGFDGKQGISVIAWNRQAVELSLATEQFGKEFFRNGTNVGAVVSTDKKLSDKTYERLKLDLQEKYEGLGRAHKMMLLEEGLTFSKNTIPPNDAQFLETRKFQTTEIARMFGVPPHMLADLERATFSNIEHQSIEFVRDTIRPWLVRVEQGVNWKLFTEAEKKRLFVEFLVDGLMRGDIKSRYEAYKIGLNNGWLCANDIREFENMNPIDGGDIYLTPLNMIPTNMLLVYWESKLKAETDPLKGGEEGNGQGEGNQGAEGDPPPTEPPRNT